MFGHDTNKVVIEDNRDPHIVTDLVANVSELFERVIALETHRDAAVDDINEQDSELKALSDAFFALAERLGRLEERSTAPAESTEFVQGVTSRLGVVYDAVEELESFLLNR